MYRLLEAKHGGVRERRDQLTHPAYAKPELLAERPNELWSWDVSKLKGPAKWTYFYLYVILDVFSRYVVGWTVQHRENGQLAKALIEQATEQQQIGRSVLTLHADRGAPQRAKPVAFLLADMGITKTHSRPYTSSDNPYSEAHFKTLKYRPEFPERFDDIEHARGHCRVFFDWYNHQHRHSGIGLMTPAAVHYGRAHELHAQRTACSTQPTSATPSGSSASHPSPRAADRRLDQQAQDKGDCSLNSITRRLNRLDKFRTFRGTRCAPYRSTSRGLRTNLRHELRGTSTSRSLSGLLTTKAPGIRIPVRNVGAGIARGLAAALALARERTLSANPVFAARRRR